MYGKGKYCRAKSEAPASTTSSITQSSSPTPSSTCASAPGCFRRTTRRSPFSATDLAAVDLNSDTARLPFPPDEAALMTDIPRLRAGKVGGQFWSVWVPAQIKGFEAVQVTFEQIDLGRVEREVARDLCGCGKRIPN